MDIRQKLRQFLDDEHNAGRDAAWPGVLCRDALAEIERLEGELRESNKALTVTLRLSPDIVEVVGQLAALKEGSS